MDILSDVLRGVRLEGALFLHAEFREPWCVQAPDGATLARVLQPRATQLAVCHLVLSGRCWVRPDGSTPLALEAGDVVVLAHGHAHLIGSGLQHAPVTLDHVVEPRLPDLHRIRYGGHGALTDIVCGWFAYERHHAHPLMAGLPPAFRTSITGRPAGRWLTQSVRHALAELSAGQPGAEVMAARVAETLFMESLRGFITDQPPHATGWLAALHDPAVARALALMHADPRRDWTLSALAQAVGASRSVLAERFVRQVGAAPMRYLTRWRLTLAAARLSESQVPLARVAEDAGYGSEAAFTRAFKREHGMAPGRWRQQAVGGTPSR